MRICSVVGCNKKHAAKGFCKTHYYRMQRNGDLNLRSRKAGECLDFLKVAAKSRDSGCITWPFWKYTNGYGGITISGRKRVASRVSCEIANGPPENDAMQAAHSCGNRDCVNGSHIRWATVSENHADKVAHGTTNRGERQGLSVLTESEVLYARAAKKVGLTHREIAERLGKKTGTIAAAVRGANWKFIEPPKKPEQEAMDL